jgi:hypothetical protein
VSKTNEIKQQMKLIETIRVRGLNSGHTALSPCYKLGISADLHIASSVLFKQLLIKDGVNMPLSWQLKAVVSDSITDSLQKVCTAQNYRILHRVVQRLSQHNLKMYSKGHSNKTMNEIKSSGACK